MTTNISSLQSELLKLLNANGDITQIEYEDAVSTANINGDEQNKDLKGGADLSQIVDNMLGGNIDSKQEAPPTNDKSPKEIIGDMLLDSNEGNGAATDNGTTIEKIIDDIYENEDKSIKGGNNETTTEDETKDETEKKSEDKSPKQNTNNDDTDSDSDDDSDASDETDSDSESDASDETNSDSDENDNEQSSTPTQEPSINDDSDSDDSNSDSDDSDSDDSRDLSSKYISIINEFNSKPVRMTGGLVGGSSGSEGRVKIIPMFPYVVKQYD